MGDVMRLRLHAKFSVDRNPFHGEERHSLSLYGRAVAATGACRTAIAPAGTTAILAFVHAGDTPRVTATITARRERRHMTEPCDLTAVEARRLIGAKRLAPTELLASCIDRIEAIDHAVNAVPARDFQRARTAAQRADAAVARGADLPALHGLPIGIKDLQETAGLVTTHGSVLFKDFIPDQDMSAVAAVRRAGAIIVGKTNTPEFGAGANTRNTVYGATGNPFDPSKSCAGSSGGSAVALATGMVPICTGSDTGGSLRNPAAFNGIVGFRPSPGLVSSDKRGIGWSNLPVVGPMSRTVADTCLLLGSMASDDVSDPLAYSVHGRTVRSAKEFHPPPAVDLSRLRVAMTPDFGFAPTERHIAEVFAEKTGLFRHIFARADDASPDCSGCDEAFEVLRSLGFLAAHADKVRDRPDDVGPNVRANVVEGQRYSAADVARAMTTQTQIYRRWQGFFQHYDVILSPAITISPRSWRELYPAEIDGRPTRTYFHWLALAYAVTVPGHPALSLPVGVDRLGMPFGLQIVGPRGGDALVLAVAHALETMLVGDARTARPVPDLAMLRAAPPIREAEGFRGFD
jgi:amidase